MNTPTPNRIDKLNQLTTPLLEWYSSAARDLPWRTPASETHRPDPYHVLGFRDYAAADPR